jgi:hypothetical protein
MVISKENEMKLIHDSNKKNEYLPVIANWLCDEEGSW